MQKPIEDRELMIELLKEAIQTDGSHHKQWYLFEMLEIMDKQIANDMRQHIDDGICP